MECFSMFFDNSGGVDLYLLSRGERGGRGILSTDHTFLRRMTWIYIITVGLCIVTVDIMMSSHTTLINYIYIIVGEIVVLALLTSGFYLEAKRLYYKNVKNFDRYIQLLKEHAATVEKNNRLEIITENIETGIFVIDSDEREYPITFANKGFETLSGYDATEVMGRNFRVLQGTMTDPTTIHEIDEALRKKQYLQVELLTYHKNGHYFWSELRLHPIVDRYGNVSQFICFQADISQRKQAEFLLEESKQRYKSLFYNHPDLVLSIDLQGKVLSVNPEVQRITGYEVDEIIGKHYLEHVERSSSGCDSLLEAGYNGESYRAHLKVKHKKGCKVDLQVYSVPIKVRDKVVGLYVIARDMTEYNKTQEILRRSDKLNVVGELAAGIAHEIRNPLTSLKGFTQLIGSAIQGDQNQYIQVMEDELNRINEIVSELLLLARPQMTDFEEESLPDILYHVQTLLNAQAIMNNVHIEVAYYAKSKYIVCVEHQIKQVFINIIKNAIEAMPKGGTINVVVTQSAIDKVLVKISDEGVGIPKARLEKLGEPFYTTKERGTGLGLMVSMKIIEEHSGVVYIQSEENVGTTFELILPAKPM